MTKNDDSDVIGDIFFSHPVAQKLVNAYPYVVQGDCTYNTNCYGLKFMQIMGFTLMGKNFTIAHVFLEHEREVNYTWVCKQLRCLFAPRKLSIVFIPDAAQAFINAVECIFPECRQHLCRGHIEVNVRKMALSYAGLPDCRKYSCGDLILP